MSGRGAGSGAGRDAGRDAGRPRAAPLDEGGPEELDAAAAALARARATAAEAGLRPGSAPQRKRRVGSGAEAGGRRDGRDFALIGDAVDSIVTDRGWNVDVAAGSVMGRWPQIVGPELAAHVAPVTFEDGVLTVRCESTAWATQLRLMQSQLLARITDDIGAGVVVELRIVGPSAPSWARGPRRVSDGRGPRDTYG